MAQKPPPHDGHASFGYFRSIAPPDGYRPIASRNTSGAGAPPHLVGKKPPKTFGK